MNRRRISSYIDRYMENLRYPEMVAGGAAFFAVSESIYSGEVSGLDKPEAIAALGAGTLSGVAVGAAFQAFRIRRQNRLSSAQDIDGAGSN